ncbi:MAG: glycosyltransferase [Planctomycetales bacterium]|nr:glycosyltransferase [Planctomycetales bacterium]
MPQPELAVLISAYERPAHLRRCLFSLMLQEEVAGRFEVVVTDDGSSSATLDVVREFAREAAFPVKLTTHRHDGFRLARCRNEGIALCTAPYVLMSDGDCVFPRDHLHCHLSGRRQGFFVAGDCFRLSEVASAQVDLAAILSDRLMEKVHAQERRRLGWKTARAIAYTRLQLRMLPRLTGCNMAVWRDDLLAVNGFDERFVGWGLEDRDIQRRLETLGRRCRTILPSTAAFHLWHPPVESFVRNNVGTPNLAYYESNSHSVRCLQGLANHLGRVKDLLEPSCNRSTGMPPQGLLEKLAAPSRQSTS